MSIKAFPKKGEIWYVHTPNQPFDPHQPRPAIIVSRDGRNMNAPDLMVVPAFSNISAMLDVHVEIPKGEGGMPDESIAKCDQVTTIHRSLLAEGPLGERINQAIMWKIHRAVRRAMGETKA